MNSGTFNDCSNCNECPDCCSNFLNIDNPILSLEEIEEIKRMYHVDNFYEMKENGTYCLKTNSNGHCVFFMNKDCMIYAKRPADCKLYPYDIIQDNGSYYLILYKLRCIDENVFSSDYEVERILPVVESVLPWIENFTNESNYERMSDLPYKVLKKVK